MFGKSKTNSSAAITKDINESIKTLSYLARAEKYFDLELKKNGQVTKPLLKIVDIIDPLRQIGESTSKLGKGQKLDDASAKQVFASAQIRQIVEVANDILALNPKGLVSSDKTALSKLSERLNEASKLAGMPIAKSAPEEVLMPKAKKAETAPTPVAKKPEQKIEEKPAPANTNDNIQTGAQNFGKAKAENTAPVQKLIQVEEAAAEENEDEQTFISPIATGPSAAGDFPQTEYKNPLAWNSNPNAAQGFRKLGEETPAPVQTQYQPPQQSAPQYQQPVQQSQPQVSKQYNEESMTNQDDTNNSAPVNTASEQTNNRRNAAPAAENAQDANAEQANNQSQKVVPLKQNKKEFNLPQKYFATSYSGMNLQEAAEILSELVEDPANLEIIMLEHASRVKPIAEGKEIISDLLAIAPLADSFETGTEINDKKHLSVLKDAERIISICKDIANVKIEGFDRRKQKLFEKFIPEDIKKTVEWAKIAYPEVFAGADAQGETVSDVLLDLSDLIITYSDETGDRVFAELLSQVVSQIVLYAEHNDLRLKFDIVTKKNKLNSNPQPLQSRSEVAVLRALTFVPKIARQGQDILHADNITQSEQDTVNKALDILQLAYVHARDNYSAEINSFYDNKAA